MDASRSSCHGFIVLKVHMFWHLRLLLCICLVTVATLDVGEDKPIRASDQAWINSLFYLPTEPRVRKEYRLLSDDERNKYHDAFVQLKQDTSVKPNKYTLLVSLHARRSSRNSAHRGTGFLGWHRVFTLLMENALREKAPSVTMPYWDCTLDSAIPLPRASSIWSADFMGNGDGFVNVGVFKDWTTQRGRLYRTVGGINGPLTDKNISRLFQYNYIGNISYPRDKRKDKEDVFEFTHNRVHNWIGGEMKLIETAGDDPIFYMYHSFISLIWQKFRDLQRSKGIDPELDWDEYYGQSRHHKYSPMGLGNLMAIDGSSNVFEENIVFTDQPSCSRQQTDCKSPYLYCNIVLEKCAPWTNEEYENIKSAANYRKISFSEEVKVHIQQKIQAGNEELQWQNGVMPDNHAGHQHGNHHHVHAGHQSHGDDDNDFLLGSSHGGEGHNHESHDHMHNLLTASIQGHKLMDSDLAMLILAGILFLYLVFYVSTKCASEKRKCKKNKRKYNMDGIVNVNFDDEGNKVSGDESAPVTENRSDNVYTITVTSNGENDGTFVRFAKFSNDSPQQVRNGIETPNRGNHTDNYMDMGYASHVVNKDTFENENSDDIFEKETNLDEDEESESEMDERYNSIENENFDLSVFSNNGSEDGKADLFDDYDNLVFRKEEAVPEPRLEVDDTMADQMDFGKFYTDFFPDTHM